MKRTQMISKIHARLQGIRPEVDFAKQILDFVEESGMVPPAFLHVPEATEEYPVPPGELVNKWEPET